MRINGKIEMDIFILLLLLSRFNQPSGAGLPRSPEGSGTPAALMRKGAEVKPSQPDVVQIESVPGHGPWQRRRDARKECNLC